MKDEDRFRLSDCKQCEALLVQLKQVTDVAIMYREQIKQYQQREQGWLRSEHQNLMDKK